MADLQEDGDREIIARKSIESGKKSRGIVVFDYATGMELYCQRIGPMVGDVSIGRMVQVDIVHGTDGPDNGLKGSDGSVDNRSYVFSLAG